MYLQFLFNLFFNFKLTEKIQIENIQKDVFNQMIMKIQKIKVNYILY